MNFFLICSAAMLLCVIVVFSGGWLLDWWRSPTRSFGRGFCHCDRCGLIRRESDVYMAVGRPSEPLRVLCRQCVEWAPGDRHEGAQS